MGWEVIWKDAHQEKSVSLSDDGVNYQRLSSYRRNLVVHLLDMMKSSAKSADDGAGCHEYSYMDLEGILRSNDRASTTLLVGQGVNVEVNQRITGCRFNLTNGNSYCWFTYVSLRRWSDVISKLFALGAALLWMQGMIGHLANLTSWLGFTIIARSQFSNLLPILY